MTDLKKLVLDKIASLGTEKASEYFGVSTPTIFNWQLGKTRPSLDAAQLILSEHTEADDVDDVDQPGVETAAQPFVTSTIPAEVTMWEGRKVMLLCPVYRSYHPYTFFTLFANYARYGPEKIGMIVEGRTLIHEARNILIAKALGSEAETFIMPDDDMVFPCGSEGLFNGKFNARVPRESAELNAISRLMSHGSDKGIIGALYFGRNEIATAQCSSAFTNSDENERLHTFTYKGLKTEEWVGTGLIKIERWVIEQMKKEIDAGRWPECKRTTEKAWDGYFTPKQVGVGEDVSFCQRAKEIGIQSYLDTSLICLHIGEKLFGPRG